MKLGRVTPGALVLLGLAILSGACGGGGDGDGGDEPNPYGIESEVVTTPGQVSALAFAPDGRLFFSEHWTGNILILGADGQPLAEPFAHVESGGVFQLGLSGLALDPDFATNHYVYAFYLEKTGSEPQPVGR